MDSLVLRSAPAARLTMIEELSALPTAELRGELAKALGLTAANLLRLAVIVSILEDRGEDMAAFKGGFLDILRKIARGDLLPDIVVLFSAEPEKIKRAGALPIEGQREIVEGRRIVPDRKRTRSYGPEVGRLPDPAGSTLPNVFHKMGSQGNPRDVGETAAEMVLACQSPKDAAQHLLAALRKAGVVA